MSTQATHDEPDVLTTTSIVYGLPEVERARLVRQYRTDFHAAAHNRPCQLSYDLACQYLKNLHEVQKASADLGYESEDSIISNDSSEPPPLESASTSPVIVEVPASLHIPSSSAAPRDARETKDVELWYAYWGKKVDGFGEWGLPGSLMTGLTTDGKGAEWAWASVGSGSSDNVQAGGIDGSVDSHHLRIISLHGIRDLDCTCPDGKHADENANSQVCVNAKCEMLMQQSYEL
ncbi:hypothetical protein DFH07DRAFT_785649 [Mycena maculata]|uniref:Uncharacterized protein n=1 Tax=Mycena maculata TaxID=230809 RepID=A0AAD7HA42_9AGAR|nr:hypothetical protein DFH07DRAFT_785649 [Mycena maculata]